MPESVKFLPQKQVLTFEEIVRIVRIVAANGVNKLRITGGEPLLRSQVWTLISMLKSITGIQEVALTTNGLLLAEQAEKLKSAGLDRLNISLDTVNPESFERISRRKGLDKVFAGIDAAKSVGFDRIRLNAVSIAGTTEQEIVPLAKFAREKMLELRFIEFMPLDAEESWGDAKVLSGSQVRQIIDAEIGRLEPATRTDDSQPAVDYRYTNGGGIVGFIDSVTNPFCGQCNRMRITAEGKFRNCLFSAVEWDLRSLLRADSTDAEIESTIREAISAKKAGHGTDDGKFLRPAKAMYQIGG